MSVIVVCIYRDTALILGPAVEAACVGYCTLCCPTFIAPDRLIQSYRQRAKGCRFICNDVIILYGACLQDLPPLFNKPVTANKLP